MTIASSSFLIFALVTILAYNSFSSVAWRKWVLLAADLAFLTTFSHNPAAFIPFALFVVFGYVCVLAMQRTHSKAIYLCTVAGTLLLFFWLKKYTFLPHATFLRLVYTTLGLSYIFFRVMHMIIDAHEGGLSERVSFVSYLNYTLNFTTLVSGPIQGYPEFIEQHLSPVRPPLTIVQMGVGLERIVIGFFKVNVVAMVLSMIQNQAINALSATQPLATRAMTGAIIAAAYPVYLYYNFSGYTDIVIGVARFLRIELPENFNRPFSTDNFLDFWNHWHMTLSGWLKKYVYNSLLKSLMRRFPSPKIELYLGVVAFFVTFFLIGVWHGRTSEFIFYGVLLGIGVSVNKLYQVKLTKVLGKKQYRALSNNWIYQTICRGLNFTFFSFYLLWFWSTWKDLDRMSNILRPQAQLLGWFLILAISTVVLAIWEVLREGVFRVRWGDQPFISSRYVRTVWDTSLVFILLVVMKLLNAPAPDIVYKAF